jgi:hypothetical protein
MEFVNEINPLLSQKIIRENWVAGDTEIISKKWVASDT